MFLVAEVFKQEQLRATCRARGLYVGGTKLDLAARIVVASTRGGEDTRPTRAQLTYIAAASRRQNIGISVEALCDRHSASVWLADHGDPVPR